MRVDHAVLTDGTPLCSSQLLAAMDNDGCGAQRCGLLRSELLRQKCEVLQHFSLNVVVQRKA